MGRDMHGHGAEDLVPHEGVPMRSLVLLALVTLAALPLSARDHGRDRRAVVVVRESCRPSHRWEARHYDDRRWDDRWERHAYYGRHARRHDCDDDRVFLRPLAPPFAGRVVLRFR